MEFERLYQELVHGRDIIHALVSGVTQAEAQIKPDADSWSILEVVCHLYDEEREDFREHLDLILNRPNDEWAQIDPDGWVKSRSYNDRSLNESLDGFLAERDHSLEWLRDMAAADWDASYTTRFGTLTAGDMLGSWVAHDNLHMRQLVELRRVRLLAQTAPYNIRYGGEW